MTNRHFRRIAFNKYCKAREKLHTNKIIQHSFCNANILNTINENNNVNEYKNVNSVCNFPKSIEQSVQYCNIDKDVFESRNKITVADKIAQWIIKNNISHNSSNELLSILKSENLPVPKDCRTLLKTPLLCNDIVNIPPGEYVHLGIEKGILEKMHKNISTDNLEILPLTINIDGLPLSKSSKSQFWPILMSIDLLEISEPFIVGIYHGYKKPESVKNFLDAFVKEYLFLRKNGIIINNKLITPILKKIICDAPATAFVLSIKSHTGYFGCNKCTQKGKFIRGKMTFPEFDAPLRTDENFALQSQQEHHKDSTPLEKISIGLVSNVPLDYMHLVCLGVMKTLIMFWTGKKGNSRLFKLSDYNIKLISKNMKIFRKYICKEFCRLPRSIEDIEHWKATEFRQFLLYTGPIALKEKLPKIQYNHFLCLHVAIRILCSSECIRLNTYAKSLIRYFVEKYKKIYGNEYITYNVHNLLHLCDDVLLFGKLDNFSAFRFESYMSKIKRKLKNSRYPLQQIYNRVVEDRKCLTSVNMFNLSEENDKPLISNEDGKIYKYYTKFSHNNFTISLCQRNNCVLLRNSSYMLISNIYKNENDDIKIFGKIFQNVYNFTEKPSFSLAIKIINIHEESYTSVVDYEDIKTKCILLPINDKFVVIPLLHNNL